jgi:hypothetical protein
LASDLTAAEIAESPVTRNTLKLLRSAVDGGGLKLTATANLSRAVVCEMLKIFEWPHYDNVGALSFNKVVNEPDFLPLHFVLTRLCTIPVNAVLETTWDRGSSAMEARILRPLMWFGLLECGSEKESQTVLGHQRFYRKAPLFDRFFSFDVRLEAQGVSRH